MMMSFCSSVRLFVRLFVACEIRQVIRYVAAPGGKLRLIVSTLIDTDTRCLCATVLRISSAMIPEASPGR